MIHAPTGTGKTYAAWAGPLIEWMDEQASKPMPKRAPELRVLWITPLRALVKDTTHSLCSMIEELGLPWTVEERTGDTTGAMKAYAEVMRLHPGTAWSDMATDASKWLTFSEEQFIRALELGQEDSQP